MPRAKHPSTHTRENRVVSMEAKPERVTFDVKKTAVLVIDMQNDFGSKRGLFDRARIDISAIRAAIEPTKKVLEAARAAGVKIVYLKMGFHADLSDLGTEGSPNRERHLAFGVGQASRAPDGREGRFLIRDTWNTDIVPELAPGPQDIVLYKHRFSGFYETELHEKLQTLGITDLIVTGCTTSICVDSTIRDAMFRDYRCVLLADCTAEPIGHDLARSNHEASLLAIQMLLGWTSNSAEFIRALSSQESKPQAVAS